MRHSPPAPIPPTTPRWARPSGVVAIALLWGVFHASLRLSLSPAIPIDDALESYFAQAFDWGYRMRQPPLYDWLLLLLQPIYGPGEAAFQIIKYAALTIACVATYGCARRVSDDPRVAALCALSMSAIYQIGWNAHEGVTHSILLTAAVPLSALALIRLAEAPSALRAAALGAAVAFGLLSKHGYFATLALFAIAAAATPQARDKLRARDLAVATAVAALLYSPYAAWMAGQDGSLLDVSRGTLAGTEAKTILPLRLLDALTKPLLFLSPLWLLPVILLLAAGRRAPESEDGWLTFFRWISLAGLAAVLIGVAFLGVTTLKERHMQALFLLAPIWLWGEAARRAARPLSARAGLVALGALAGIVLLARGAGLLAPEAPTCPGKCLLAKPYDALATELPPLPTTLVAPDSVLGANLRRIAPHARVTLLEAHDWRPPVDTARGCLLVWDLDLTPLDETPERIVKESWEHLWKPPGWRVSRHGLRRLDPADPRCR